MPIVQKLAWLRRRWFGSYVVEDPRPIAESAPYTFFLPSENELLALAPGDLAKITLRSIPNSSEWDAERMWIIITAAEGDTLIGTLDNYPSDIPQLRPGDTIKFARSEVIDLDWCKDRLKPPPPHPADRTFWDRCMADDCIVEGRSNVDYLYREEPDMGQPDDQYPDSGWRIRGTDKEIAKDTENGRTPLYIAIGKVLNQDDSWLRLLDAPVGSRFIRDLASGLFIQIETN